LYKKLGCAIRELAGRMLCLKTLERLIMKEFKEEPI